MPLVKLVPQVLAQQPESGHAGTSTPVIGDHPGISAAATAHGLTGADDGGVQVSSCLAELQQCLL